MMNTALSSHTLLFVLACLVLLWNARWLGDAMKKQLDVLCHSEPLTRGLHDDLFPAAFLLSIPDVPLLCAVSFGGYLLFLAQLLTFGLFRFLAGERMDNPPTSTLGHASRQCVQCTSSKRLWLRQGEIVFLCPVILEGMECDVEQRG